MPATPARLAADLAADAVQKIAEEVRESSREAVAKEWADTESQPGEKWSASSWLASHGVVDIVAQALTRPLQDLEGSSAAELAFFRAFSQSGSRDHRRSGETRASTRSSSNGNGPKCSRGVDAALHVRERASNGVCRVDGMWL